MKHNINLKIINQSNNPLPKYETEGSAGFDLRAFMPEPITIKPLERLLIPTGLFIEIPDGYEGQVRPRSGLAFKKGLTMVNSPGTIDSDYRGELKIIIINLSQENQTIESGERIAQMVITPYAKATFVTENELSNTTRGEGGFGSTGVKE